MVSFLDVFDGMLFIELDHVVVENLCVDSDSIER